MNFKTAFTAALFAASTQAGSSIIDLVGEAEDTLPPIGLPGFILPPVLTTRYAYCKMQWDPYYPTTNPYGQFKMKQTIGQPMLIKGWMSQLPQTIGQPMLIKGWMNQLPVTRLSAHGFAFNVNPVDRRACKSTEHHFNPTDETHGMMNDTPSHVGNLTPIYDDWNGEATYGTEYAERPTLFWGTNSVVGRSMALYERPDDFGTKPTSESAYNGSMGRMIACCNVQVFRVQYDGLEDQYMRYLDDDEEGVEVYTFKDYRQHFGEDFDPADWDEDAIAFGHD